MDSQVAWHKCLCSLHHQLPVTDAAAGTIEHNDDKLSNTPYLLQTNMIFAKDKMPVRLIR